MSANLNDLDISAILAIFFDYSHFFNILRLMMKEIVKTQKKNEFVNFNLQDFEHAFACFVRNVEMYNGIDFYG